MDAVAPAACWYASGHSVRDPRLSPVFNDEWRLPPMIVFVGSDEILLGDARTLTYDADRATLVVAPHMQHVWPIWVGAFPEAGAAMHQAGDWVRDHSIPAGV